jgi:DedD protein
VKERLKHRLLGAAILVALGVLLLPGFFRDKDAYSVNTQSQIPTKPSITAVDFDGPTPVEGVEPAPAPETMFVPEELPVVEGSNVDEAVASSVASVKLPEAWVIQVASFGQKEAAEKLLKELQTEGQKAYLRSVVTDKGTMHRLFIGPKMDKQEAITIKTAIDKRLKVDARILPYKP